VATSLPPTVVLNACQVRSVGHALSPGMARQLSEEARADTTQVMSKIEQKARIMVENHTAADGSFDDSSRHSLPIL
jgi:hypothetical protein